LKILKKLSVEALAELINCPVIGNKDIEVTGLNEIHKVEPGDVVFVDHEKYYEKALNSAASVIIINDENASIPKGKAIIISNQPFKDFNYLTNYFQPLKLNPETRGEQVNIGNHTFIHSTAVIGNNVSIGEHCIVHANVTIYDNAILGDHVVIHANTVIGANAFYYKKLESKYNPMYTCGTVIIEDHVEIGALSSIDRGVTGDTIIGAGSKLDNQVHVGHDTTIGKNCLFAAQVGIAGCVTIEDNVTLWGQVGVPSDIVIGKGAVVLGQSGIAKNLDPDKTYFGSPASEARMKFRELAAIKKLPQIIENLP
jgi:UDP-3-O-[3-hydroxymyristoyl] glucosamine N-acyltransferase